MRAAVWSSSAGKQHAHPDDARSAVDTYHRTKLATLDGDLWKALAESFGDLARVSFRIAIDHAQSLQRTLGHHQLHEPAKRTVNGAHAFHGRHLAVEHAQDRLDAEQCSGQGGG